MGAALPALAHGQGRTVRTNVGIQQGLMVGIIDSGAFRIDQSTPALLKASSRPVVRANAGWTLVAELLVPQGSTVRATVTRANMKVQLSAEQPRAVVSSSSAACARCEVPLSWQFTGDPATPASAKGPPPAMVLPGVRYSLEPKAP